MVKSVGKISSVSLSMTDTGTPEFVNRICVPWLFRSKGGKGTRAYLPGSVWCIRSHQSPGRERKAQQRLAQCDVELFDIQDLWNYVGGLNLLHGTRI